MYSNSSPYLQNTPSNLNQYPTDGLSTPGFPENSSTPPISSVHYNNTSINSNPDLQSPNKNYFPPNLYPGQDYSTQKENFAYSFKGLSSRICEIDSCITKYNDFLSLCYGMLIWSILCFLLSIWYISTRKREADITIDEEGVYYEVEKTRHNWYTFLCFFVNFGHCITYFYSIRAYHHQSNFQMSNAHICLLILAISNFMFFIIYMFFVKEGFFTFCVDLIFLIFNALLWFQSKELAKLYEEKEKVKIMYQ